MGEKQNCRGRKTENNNGQTIEYRMIVYKIYNRNELEDILRKNYKQLTLKSTLNLHNILSYAKEECPNPEQSGVYKLVLLF